MSIPLSGQLGSAQLGAAQLGALQSVSTGAGFLPFFPDTGAVKEAAPPKKKRKKRQAKKAKKRRPKLTPTVSESLKPAESTGPRVSTVPTTVIPPETVIAVEPFNTAEYLKLQADIYRQERLRETIAEDDELLLLLTS